MKFDEGASDPGACGKKQRGKGKAILETRIGESLDMLVEFLVDHHVTDIHPLIMGEVEKRLIIKVLQRSRGNKLQAAKWLGMSRATFHRKIQKLTDSDELLHREPEG